jgi:hypothetical protein
MKKREHDEIQFGPEIAPGVHSALRRTPDGKIREVACSPLRDGVPLSPNSEIANVSKETEDGWHTLTDVCKLAGDGPAQVATPAYREGWSRIYAKSSN